MEKGSRYRSVLTHYNQTTDFISLFTSQVIHPIPKGKYHFFLSATATIILYQSIEYHIYLSYSYCKFLLRLNRLFLWRILITSCYANRRLFLLIPKLSVYHYSIYFIYLLTLLKLTKSLDILFVNKPKPSCLLISSYAFAIC